MFIVDNIAIYLLAFTNCFLQTKRPIYLEKKNLLFGNLAIWKIKHRVSNVSNTTGGWHCTKSYKLKKKNKPCDKYLYDSEDKQLEYEPPPLCYLMYWVQTM